MPTQWSRRCCTVRPPGPRPGLAEPGRMRPASLDAPQRCAPLGRTPDQGASANQRGLEILIAGAGGAAHLPGVVAANTLLPVIGVPIPSTSLNGMDSLLSIVQMPKGIPVATMAIGKAGGANAGLFAAAILAL